MMSQLDLHPSSAAQNRAGVMESSPLSGLYRRSGKRALDVALVLAAAPFVLLVVAILALCVTAIMVGVTHALRTARDGFSMFLAGLTGLILTFGPLLLVML